MRSSLQSAEQPTARRSHPRGRRSPLLTRVQKVWCVHPRFHSQLRSQRLSASLWHLSRRLVLLDCRHHAKEATPGARGGCLLLMRIRMLRGRSARQVGASQPCLGLEEYPTRKVLRVFSLSRCRTARANAVMALGKPHRLVHCQPYHWRRCQPRRYQAHVMSRTTSGSMVSTVSNPAISMTLRSVSVSRNRRCRKLLSKRSQAVSARPHWYRARCQCAAPVGLGLYPVRGIQRHPLGTRTLLAT
mmetsp:Transcript_121619/g.278790  ORF Transcript_121619/g.278790 Transcript_121619/m.278790 type:complete len:244 (-) Transcript_121619:185-916(-)